MEIEQYLAQINEMVVLYMPKVIAAIAVFIIGRWLISGVNGIFKRTLEKKNIDSSLHPILIGLVDGLLKVMLVISVLGMLGIQMTSFIAVLGAIGLAVGMALSGTLQNFAGSVLILIFKPFKVGDVIEAQGYIGSVSEIQIFNTIIKTGDNKTVIIPNGTLSKASMTNYSTEARRRVDWTFGIAYGDDVDSAREVIKRLCNEDERILKEPEVMIAVSALADSSVNFTVRAWVNAKDYWPVFFAMNEKVYKAFPKEGLNIPFPQMDVHLHKSES